MNPQLIENHPHAARHQTKTPAQTETTPKFLDMEPLIRQARGTAEALLSGLSEENHLLEGAAEALARQTDELHRIFHGAQRAQAIKLHPAQPLSAQEISSKQLAEVLGRIDSLTQTITSLESSEADVDDLRGAMHTAAAESRSIANTVESIQQGLQADGGATRSIDEGGYYGALSSLELLYQYLLSEDQPVDPARLACAIDAAVRGLKSSVVI